MLLKNERDTEIVKHAVALDGFLAGFELLHQVYVGVQIVLLAFGNKGAPSKKLTACSHALLNFLSF